MVSNRAIALSISALLVAVGTASAQRTDPRVADLVQAGQIRFGLFSSQYTKDPATGELKGVRPDIARALAARIGVPAILLEHRSPPEVVACIKAGVCDVVFLPRDERASSIADFSTNSLVWVTRTVSTATARGPSGTAAPSWISTCASTSSRKGPMWYWIPTDGDPGASWGCS